jgi:hypothetical protein
MSRIQEQLSLKEQDEYCPGKPDTASYKNSREVLLPIHPGLYVDAGEPVKPFFQGWRMSSSDLSSLVILLRYFPSGTARKTATVKMSIPEVAC